MIQSDLDSIYRQGPNSEMEVLSTRLSEELASLAPPPTTAEPLHQTTSSWPLWLGVGAVTATAVALLLAVVTVGAVGLMLLAA
jgi:hypothetical protein